VIGWFLYLTVLHKWLLARGHQSQTTVDMCHIDWKCWMNKVLLLCPHLYRFYLNNDQRTTTQVNVTHNIVSNYFQIFQYFKTSKLNVGCDNNAKQQQHNNRLCPKLHWEERKNSDPVLFANSHRMRLKQTVDTRN
jgi:hypothetical protein